MYLLNHALYRSGDSHVEGGGYPAEDADELEVAYQLLAHDEDDHASVTSDLVPHALDIPGSPALPSMTTLSKHHVEDRAETARLPLPRQALHIRTGRTTHCTPGSTSTLGLTRALFSVALKNSIQTSSSRPPVSRSSVSEPTVSGTGRNSASRAPVSAGRSLLARLSLPTTLPPRSGATGNYRSLLERLSAEVDSANVDENPKDTLRGENENAVNSVDMNVDTSMAMDAHENVDMDVVADADSESDLSRPKKKRHRGGKRIPMSERRRRLYAKEEAAVEAALGV